MKTIFTGGAVVALMASTGLAGSIFDNGMANYTSLDIVSPTGSQVYNNGDAEFGDGNELTAWLQAEDFMLGSANSVSGATFSLLNTVVGNGNANWDGALEWFIFDSSGGQPGNVIASGNAQNVSVNFVLSNGFDFYDVAFDFGQSVALAGGTNYYFGLHMAADYSVRSDLYWGDTLANGTDAGWESTNGTQDNWLSNGQEHAFTLTPAPGSLAILGLGGLAATRRRR